MTDLALPALDLHEVRITVLDWPAGDDAEPLGAALDRLCADHERNAGWLETTGERPQAFWRGMLPGGLATAALTLLPAAGEAGVDLHLTDGRVDVLIQDGVEHVMVIAPMGRMHRLDREEFERLVRESDDPALLCLALLMAGEDVAGDDLPADPSAPPSLPPALGSVRVVERDGLDLCDLRTASWRTMTVAEDGLPFVDGRAIGLGEHSLATLLPPGAADEMAGSQWLRHRWRVLQTHRDSGDTDVCLVSLGEVLEILPRPLRRWARDLHRQGIELAGQMIALGRGAERAAAKADRKVLRQELG